MNDKSAEKMAATKNENSRQEVLGAIEGCGASQAEPKLAIPTHRKKRHITFEEYKGMIKSGMTPQQIIEQTSKHIIYFYNALLAGKIKLDRDEFEQEYLSGTSLDEMGIKHGISRGHITFLREFYGIKRKGATFQRRLTEEQPLSDEAKSILVGSILGDGHIHPLGYWSEKHCIEQADYLRWKASFVPSITTEKSFVEYKAYDKRYKKFYRGLSFRTRAHSYLYELGGLFYCGEKQSRIKVIPENIADLLDEQALAVWFMDDGSTDWGYRNGVKQAPHQQPVCTIHTESFAWSYVKRLCDCLQTKFGLVCKPHPKDRKAVKYKWVIRFDSDSSSRMISMLRRFSVPCLAYKLHDYAKEEKS